MAAPKRNRSNPSDPAFEKTREKIRSTQLVNALMDHVLGKNGREDMKPTQITAALGLLKKVLPDMQAIGLTGDENNPVVITQIQRTIVDTKE